MTLTFEEAIKKIVENFDSLQQEKGYSVPEMEAVWCGRSDTAGSYEVDEEWVGVTRQGEIAWAYASGCSCWDGDFSEERFASIKEGKLNHTQNTPEDWQKAIIAFAETSVMQDLK